MLQLCACVLATLQTAWLCAHRLIRTSSHCIWPLTEYVCAYNVLLFFNFFSMLSASHFIQLEGDKGGSLYFMKLNRCHSANTQNGEGTQCFIYISYQKQNQKNKKERKATESHLDSFQLQRNVRIKTGRVYSRRNRIWLCITRLETRLQ